MEVEESTRINNWVASIIGSIFDSLKIIKHQKQLANNTLSTQLPSCLHHHHHHHHPQTIIINTQQFTDMHTKQTSSTNNGIHY
jgi:hypothetical protein